MGKRGRKPASELQVVPVEFGKRPPVPKALNSRQAEIWERTVVDEVDGHFKTRALQDMLADYCRHREMSEALGETINEFKPEWVKSEQGAKKLGSLLRMRDAEARAAADKATKLRMTNQSRYTPQSASTASTASGMGDKPWEF